jgi:hypothetical protein
VVSTPFVRQKADARAMANMAGDPLSPGSFMLIGVPFESGLGETRVAVTPETAKKRIAQGHVIRVQSGAGAELFYMDKTMMVVGDAKKVIEDMAKAIE